VLLACGVAALDGARRGFGAYAGELCALGLGLVVGLVAFPVLGGLFQRAGAGRGVADFASFLLVVVAVHGVVLLVWQRVSGWDWRWPGVDPAAGAAPAVGLVVVLAVVVLNGLAVVPDDTAGGLVRGSASGAAATRVGVLQEPLRVLLAPAAGPGAEILAGAPDSNPGEDAFYRLKFPSDLAVDVDAAGETAMLGDIDQARSAMGLAPVRGDPVLQRAAREHSLDMYRRHYFSHRTPDGRTPYERLTADGATYVTAGENIAFAPDVAQGWRSLMQSPEHRANVLNPDFHCVGVGIYRGRAGLEEMITQDFSDCTQ
jgi:uncharacterized protein YkwD